jgi:hypothetical protein
MPTEAPRTRPETAQPSEASPQRVERPAAPADAASDAVPDERPSDRRATATWVEDSDASGTVRSKREMPEPDSPGG